MIAWDSHLMSYFTQVFLHSLITALAVEVLISSWRIKKPVSLLRLRYLALLLPVILPPLFKLLYPSRGDDFFRENTAIFDGSRWLRLNILDGLTFWHLALIIMGVTTILFIFQEAAPLLWGRVNARRESKKISPNEYPRLEEALNDLTSRPGMRRGDGIEIYLLQDRAPILYTSGFLRPTLMISDSLLKLLDAEELKGALAHEISHIMRNDSWKSWVLLMLRGIMFYNPVALVVFRSIIHASEKACDDSAVEMTGNPLAFASGLIKVYKAHLSAQGERGAGRSGGRLYSMASGIESSSHRIRIEQRVKRLVREKRPEAVRLEGFRLGLVAGSLSMLLFFIV